MISVLGFDFHLYGFFIGLGIVGALQASLRYAKKPGVKKELVEKAAWWAVVGGVIGARVYHVVHLWGEFYRFNLVNVLYIWQGGLGIWGAIIGGVVGLVGYWFCIKVRNYLSLRCRPPEVPNPGKLPFVQLMDVMIVGMPLGQAIGRLGNWANRELLGKNGEPLFAWEAVLNLGLYVILWQIGNRKSKTGKITGAYLIGYGLIRIFLESFRPEEIIWKWQGVPVAIIMGTISLLVGGFLVKGKQS
jgi:phosphatidylglycerol---prolipoprotein diacylglyceryl transferase